MGSRSFGCSVLERSLDTKGMSDLFYCLQLLNTQAFHGGLQDLWHNFTNFLGVIY